MGKVPSGPIERQGDEALHYDDGYKESQRVGNWGEWFMVCGGSHQRPPDEEPEDVHVWIQEIRQNAPLEGVRYIDISEVWRWGLQAEALETHLQKIACS